MEEETADPRSDASTTRPSELLFTCDADGEVLAHDDELPAVVGVAADDIVGCRVGELTDGDALDGFASTAIENGSATVLAAIGPGPTTSYEFQATRVAGTEGPSVVVRATPLVGPARDAERATSRMTDAFFTVDRDWRVTYVNDHARSILAAAMETDEDDVVGQKLWAEIPEVVDSPFHERYREAVDTQEPVSFEAYFDPVEKWFDVRAYPSESGLSVYFQDNTEEHEQLMALRERERALQRVYEATADRDRSFDETVETLLEVGCDALGVDYGTLSRIQGEDYHFENVHAPPDADVEAGTVMPVESTNCERAAATEQTLVLANVAEDAPGLADRAGNADWGISCYLGAPTFVDGDVYGTFCFYDKTPREEPFTSWEVTLVDLMAQWVSEELTTRHIHERLEERNDRLEDFASIVSHDLRNPLAVVEGSLSLARETGDAEHFDRCEQAVDRMGALVDDLLELARAGNVADDPTPVDLAAVVRDCWATTATTDATLQVDSEGSVRADEPRLRQLVENLLRNAVEHGGDGVTVTVETTPDGFVVADDGAGIPEDEREDVFEAGYSSTDDGTGFGLYIVEQVASAHGWTVTVEESDGGGTRFVFSGVQRST
jgi:signal transduction histidine kinase